MQDSKTLTIDVVSFYKHLHDKHNPRTLEAEAKLYQFCLALLQNNPHQELQKAFAEELKRENESKTTKVLIGTY